MRVLVVLLFITVSSIFAQKPSAVTGVPITIGETLTVTSKILGEKRDVLVYLPPSYGKSQQRYPVIYTVDGESTFLPTASAVQFITSASEIPQMPESIVVSVKNTDRERDMPIPQEYNMGRGEENFLAFLGDELIPFIEQKYQTHPLRLFIGHSQGGLFAHYALTARPTIFQWYLPIDTPLFGFEKLRPIMDKTKTVIKEPKYRIRLVSVEGQLGWLTEWQPFIDSAPKGFFGKQIRMTNETHQTMVYKAIYEGLKQLFSDFAPTARDLKLEDLEANYKSVSEAYGYKVEIPRQVLLSSANRNSLQQNGAEALRLVLKAVALYGESPATKERLAEAEEAVKRGGPDPKIAELLNSPKPTAQQMKPFLGTWIGKLDVPDGVPLEMLTVFEIEGNEVRARGTVSAPGAKPFDQRITFIKVLDEKTLQWGGPNGRIGLNMSTAKLIDGNTLRGKEETIGRIRDPNRPLPPDPTFTYKKQ